MTRRAANSAESVMGRPMPMAAYPVIRPVSASRYSSWTLSLFHGAENGVEKPVNGRVLLDVAGGASAAGRPPSTSPPGCRCSTPPRAAGVVQPKPFERCPGAARPPLLCPFCAHEFHSWSTNVQGRESHFRRSDGICRQRPLAATPRGSFPAYRPAHPLSVLLTMRERGQAGQTVRKESAGIRSTESIASRVRSSESGPRCDACGSAVGRLLWMRSKPSTVDADGPVERAPRTG